MTFSDDEQSLLWTIFNRHPEAKARIDQYRASEKKRQESFDAMDLPELRSATIDALTTVRAILLSDLNGPAPTDSWIDENRQEMARYLLTMVENIDESSGGGNLAKWFDFKPIQESGDEGLETAIYEAVEVYDAYTRRRSP